MIKQLIIIPIVILILLCSCNRDKANIPKPTGYYRLDMPEKAYKTYDQECPFVFEMPVYSFIVKEKQEFCWMDIYFPKLKAQIYLTYKTVNNDFATHLEDSREFVYKHTVKAEAIQETKYVNDSLKVYGMLYELKGNTASPVQFFLTDSTNHFFRGSLYFNMAPNKDSLAPVIDFLREDILYLIESFEWK